MSEFIKTTATSQSLSRRRLVQGVGINDASYMVLPKINGKQVECPYYRKWRCMIVRCYSHKYQSKYPTYIGCSVVKDWLTFSNFKRWMESQDWKDKDLDKDLLIPDNKIYGPDACLFVTSKINRLLTDHAEKRGNYAQGVSWNKKVGKFKAECKVDGKKKYLGCFENEYDAESAYLIFKSKLITSVSEDSEAAKNTKLKEALIRHAKIFSNKAEQERGESK